MSMIRVPSNYSEITIGDIQKAKNDDDLNLIEAFGDYEGDINTFPVSVIKMAAAEIREVLKYESQVHKKIITIQGKEYGFIPNWELFTQGQYMDITKYLSDPINNAHKIIAILYLPVTRKYGEAYEVSRYQGTKDADIFKQVPAEQFNGAMLFFSTIKRDYLKTSLFYLTAGMHRKKKQSVVNGDGITLFRRWRMEMLRKLRGTPNYQ
jgi:hypothetical protein